MLQLKVLYSDLNQLKVFFQNAIVGGHNFEEFRKFHDQIKDIERLIEERLKTLSEKPAPIT